MKKNRVIAATSLTMFCAICTFSLLLFGCGSKSTANAIAEPSLTGTQFMKQYIGAQNEDTKALDNGFLAFFDFSDGVNLAYNVPANKSYLRDIVNGLKDNSTEFFSLANHKITAVEGSDIDIFNKITDPRSYRNQAAPIALTLDSIAKANKPALLVTDFEEYSGNRIQTAAYARDAFRNWVKNGGDITFFTMPYKEGAKEKNMYFTVFDKGDHNLLNTIRRALAGSSNKAYQEFTLANNSYEFETAYPSANQGGGFHDADGEDVVTFFIESPDEDTHYFKNGNAEFYPISNQRNYSDILDRAIALNETDKARTYPPYNFTDIFRYLFINTDRFPYADVDFDVKVYSVENDVNKFYNHLVALENNPGPGISGDEYYDEAGNLRPEYQYTPLNTATLTPIVDFLAFNPNPAVKAGEPAKAQGRELAITFNDNFTEANLNPNDCLRIDIVIKNARDLTKEELEPLFKWGNNDSLSESVRLALSDVNPKGETVYTYYMQIIN